jgi:hypothetical protein
MSLALYGRAAVSDFTGDCIVYRSLDPVDERLPRLAEIRREAGLPDGPPPRKQDAAYAQVVAWLLAHARRLDAPGAILKRLVYLGDTRLADAGAFANLCAAGNWPGMAFIGAEDACPAKVMLESLAPDQTIHLANRWAELDEFGRRAAALGFPPDESTALLIDLDKTALGARGRNAAPIDQARQQAVEQTVGGLLGAGFDPGAFRSVYARLNQPEFHPFTADNQDYLAYICLILGGGLVEVEALIKRVQSGGLASFEQFIAEIEARRVELPAGLGAIHAEIYANVLRGDPTPFKPFRRAEYRLTVRRMGRFAADLPLEARLREEILLTEEVRRLALDWTAQGALVFCLSDKPDEASLPPPELAAAGWLPIHRTPAHALGEV